MMKSMLISLLIVAVLLVLHLRPWSKDAADLTPPTKRFLGQCTTVFGDRKKPEQFCRCLWARGVRNPGDTMGKPAARATEQACDGQEGAAPGVQ